MVRSDGVVVFATNGSVVGYRIFLKPNDEEKKELPDKGGGRRRTFALMQLPARNVVESRILQIA